MLSALINMGTSSGMSVNATTADTRIAIETTTANSWNRRPTVPGMKKMGMKTATSDTEIDRTVKPTSRAPAIAARAGATPRSMCEMIASRTTIASSTTRPTAIVRPISEMLSRLRPSANIRPKVTNREIGTVTDGMKVAAMRRRNRRITITTSPTVSRMVRLTSWIELRIDTERSLSVRTDTELGNCACNRGSVARMVSITATVLASGWRRTFSRIDGLPSIALMFCTFSMLSNTCATSDSRIGWPWRVATITLAKSAARIRSAFICTVSIWRLLSSWPIGVFELTLASAAATSSNVRSTAANLAGSAWMRTA